MDMLNHQHLYYFWVVSREGTIAKACKQLHLTQPTISSQIMLLEKTLGKSLFDRRQGRLFLTAHGRVVQRYAEIIFAQSRDMLRNLETGSDGPHTLSIGTDVTVSTQVSIRLLEHLQNFSSSVHLVAEEGTFPKLLEWLHQRRLDLVLSDQMGSISDAPELIRTEVGMLDMFFVAIPSIAKTISKYPQDLSAQRLLLPVHSSPLWENIQQFLLRHKVNPRGVIGIQSPSLMRAAALKGLGVAALHELAISSDLAARRLVRVGKAPTGIRKTLWLLASRGAESNPIVDYALKTFRLKVD